jgi:mRNA interferase RelE/StbE
VILERSERFRRSYRKLAEHEKDRVRKALRLFATDMRHPSLRAKRMQGAADVWEARASRELRFTFEVIDGGVRLRNVGHHDATLRSP